MILIFTGTLISFKIKPIPITGINTAFYSITQTVIKVFLPVIIHLFCHYYPYYISSS